MPTCLTLFSYRHRLALGSAVAAVLAACTPSDHGAAQTGGIDSLAGSPSAQSASTPIVYFGTEYLKEERALAARAADPQPQPF